MVLGLGLCVPVTAEEKCEKGFVSLFNGQNLDGWIEVQGKPGSFRIQDGEIVGRRDREKGTAYWLSTQRKYSDFVLRVEYLLKPKGNSGVFIRVPGYEGRTSKEGMEIQLLDDGANTGKPNDGNTGAIYSVVGPTKFVSRPAGEWNELEVTCQGDVIEVKLNGEQINRVNMSEHPALRNRPREGFVGLSAHTDEVRFRNVRIRELNQVASE